jgi:hypothetical protein
MVQYDPTIIYKFADRLYNSAQQAIVIFTGLGILIGGAVGYMLARGVAALLGAIVLGAIGYVLGNQRAFQLKLQAQLALCQAKIEENSRTTRALP